MKIAIGYPNALRGVDGPMLIEWARRAEAAGFSSLGGLSIVTDHSHEELISLAAAAAVTSSIGLATTVLVAPLREPVMLAKQAATLDSISGGRFTLGVGAGWRRPDFAATSSDFTRRGRLLEEQIPLLQRVWAGETLSDGASAIGPPPHRARGPELLIGGVAPAALDRAGRLGDGFLALAHPPGMLERMFAAVAEARERAGRDGRPRFVGALYFALGGVEDEARANLRHAYAPGGAEFAERASTQFLSDAGVIRAALDEREAIGMDEVFLWPAVAQLEQIERLAEVVL